MERYVIIIVASILAFFALIITLYVVFREKRVNKKFKKSIINDIEIDLDDDDDLDIMPIFDISKKEIDSSMNNFALDDNINSDNVTDTIEEIKTDDEIIIVKDEKKDDSELHKDNLKKEVLVINILIDKKNYTFLANKNNYVKNERLKILFNNKVCIGVVTKSNYLREVNNNYYFPKLIVLKNNKSKTNIDTLDNSSEEIIPKKKKVLDNYD